MDRIKKILISAFVIFIISMVTILFLIKIYHSANDESLDIPKNSIDSIIKANKLDSSQMLSNETINQNRKVLIQKSLDSLNTLFIEEVSGSGLTKKAGYGRVASKIKTQIDSLKMELEKEQ